MEEQVTQLDADAIFRTVTFHDKDNDTQVIWFPAHEHHAVTDAASTFTRTSHSTLGSLENLPLELIHIVLADLDMATLFGFRHVNLRAREIVDSLPEYKIIVKESLNCLCALLRTEQAANVTLNQYYELLCTETCSTCGGYGNLVHLLGWKRCCSKCMYEEVPTLHMATAYYLKGCGYTYRDIKQMSVFKTLPGRYTPYRTLFERRFSIYVVPTCPNGAPRWSSTGDPRYSYMACCALPSLRSKTDRTWDYGLSCAGCQLRPHDSDLDFDLRDKVYSRQEYLDHFPHCTKAQRLWAASENGTKTPKLPDYCRGRKYMRSQDQADEPE